MSARSKGLCAVLSLRPDKHPRYYHETHTRHGEESRPTTVDVEAILNKPEWSVESLLPGSNHAVGDQAITSKQLHHLLRLSALPPPKDIQEENKMLSTLSAQLHFVKEIQKVDTTRIPPMQSLRDETKSGRVTGTIGLAELQEALAKEEVKGSYYKRTRRQKEGGVEDKNEAENWDVLGCAEKKVGRYFVVEGGKEG